MIFIICSKEESYKILNQICGDVIPLIYPDIPLEMGLYDYTTWEPEEIFYQDYSERFVTYFSFAKDIFLCDELNMFDMFHRDCLYFAIHFRQKNPDWNIAVLRDVNGKLLHAFCTLETPTCVLFADGRGITSSPLHFFSEFFFNYECRISIENDASRDGCEEEDWEAIGQGYRLVYNTDKEVDPWSYIKDCEVVL